MTFVMIWCIATALVFCADGHPITGGRSWVYLKGRTAGNLAALGQFDAENEPPGRSEFGFTLDKSGTLWLFGGYSTMDSDFGDVWAWNGAEWMWAFQSSSLAPIYSGSNIQPGRRLGAAMWERVDADGFIMFGGYCSVTHGGGTHMHFAAYEFSQGHLP